MFQKKVRPVQARAKLLQEIGVKYRKEVDFRSLMMEIMAANVTPGWEPPSEPEDTVLAPESGARPLRSSTPATRAAVPRAKPALQRAASANLAQKVPPQAKPPPTKAVATAKAPSPSSGDVKKLPPAPPGKKLPPQPPASRSRFEDCGWRDFLFFLFLFSSHVVAKSPVVRGASGRGQHTSGPAGLIDRTPKEASESSQSPRTEAAKNSPRSAGRGTLSPRQEAGTAPGTAPSPTPQRTGPSPPSALLRGGSKKLPPRGVAPVRKASVAEEDE